MQPVRDPLAAHLAQLPFLLTDPVEADELRRRRDRVERLVSGVEARTADPDAPLLVVVAGGSGAGKSTTVNTLAGRRVTQVGVLRPTTRRPTLVTHPDDTAEVARRRPVAGVPHLTADAADEPADGRWVAVTESAALPVGVAVLDTPDVDSVEHANRRIADDALDAADAWVWMATARTYADEAGMAYLRRARDRHAVIVLVITQLRPEDRDALLADVDRLLRDEDVPVDRRLDLPLVTVVDDRLPPEAVHELRTWLEELAPVARRRHVRERALAGLRDALPVELAPLVQAMDAEAATAERLDAALDDAWAGLPARLDADLDAGVPLRADVLEQWRGLVGAGDVLERVQAVSQRLRLVLRDVTGRPVDEDVRRIRVEVATTVTEVVARLLDDARRRARRAWEADEAGVLLLDAHPDLRAPVPDRRDTVRLAVDTWERHVAEMVATIGAQRRTRARWLSTGLNALATGAILVLFTLSGGLTGGEVGIAAAASAASQALLVRLFGEQQLQKLLADARAALHGHVRTLADADRAAFDETLAGALAPAAARAAVVGAAGENR